MFSFQSYSPSTCRLALQFNRTKKHSPNISNRFKQVKYARWFVERVCNRIMSTIKYLQIDSDMFWSTILSAMWKGGRSMKVIPFLKCQVNLLRACVELYFFEHFASFCIYLLGKFSRRVYVLGCGKNVCIHSIVWHSFYGNFPLYSLRWHIAVALTVATLFTRLLPQHILQ